MLRQLSISLPGWDEKGERKKNPHLATSCFPAARGGIMTGRPLPGIPNGRFSNKLVQSGGKGQAMQIHPHSPPPHPLFAPPTSTWCLPHGGSEAIREKVSLFPTKSRLRHDFTDD